jgi:hypothetical protein
LGESESGVPHSERRKALFRSQQSETGLKSCSIKAGQALQALSEVFEIERDSSFYATELDSSSSTEEDLEIMSAGSVTKLNTVDRELRALRNQIDRVLESKD